MKKIIIFTLLATIALAANAQSDLPLFGIKGKVLSAAYYLNNEKKYTNTFDESGRLQDFNIEMNFYGFPATIEKRSATGFEGTCSFQGQWFGYKITKANGYISKFTCNDGKGTMTMTYTYANGTLVRVDESYVYYTEDQIEYGANITGVDDYYKEVGKATDDYYKELEKTYSNPLNYLNPYGTAKKVQRSANRAANRINNAAGRVGVNTYAKTKKTRHEDKHVTLYRDYRFDDFGNWVSRTASRDGGHYAPELQVLTYDQEYWSEFYWKKIQPTGNLNHIEAFAKNSNCSDKYKRLASEYWNSHILDEIATKYDNNIDSLCAAATKAIINPQNKEKAMAYVREQVWKDEVLPISDYNRVKAKKDIKRMSVQIFDSRYRTRIDSLSSALRADSLKRLSQKMQTEFEGNKLKDALATAATISTIDPGNTAASDISYKAQLKMLQAKEADGTVTEKDYTSFIDSWPASELKPQMEDSRILLASSKFTEGTSSSELSRVLAMPASEKAHKKAEKRKRKAEFKKERGNFMHLGFGADFAAGATNTVLGGGISLRLGYTANIINFMTGVRYGYLTSTSQMFKQPKEAGKGYFDRHMISIPAMLHFNIKHGFYGCTYIGAGAEINVANMGANLRDVENYKEKNFGNSKTTITPRISFGGRLLGIEMELFATYDMDNPFDVDFIKYYQINGKNVRDYCNPNVYEKQILNDGFFDKVRGGLAMRIWL